MRTCREHEPLTSRKYRIDCANATTADTQGFMSRTRHRLSVGPPCVDIRLQRVAFGMSVLIYLQTGALPESVNAITYACLPVLLSANTRASCLRACLACRLSVCVSVCGSHHHPPSSPPAPVPLRLHHHSIIGPGPCAEGASRDPAALQTELHHCTAETAAICGRRLPYGVRPGDAGGAAR